eukprot:GEMP01080747.1.p2 GENE.GEMP01080747.1~~GEMP01080747.1.p2  ORF type:complete len:110 (-),score=4.09 GEMP01080747.1:202-531(-)
MAALAAPPPPSLPAENETQPPREAFVGGILAKSRCIYTALYIIPRHNGDAKHKKLNLVDIFLFFPHIPNNKNYGMILANPGQCATLILYGGGLGPFLSPRPNIRIYRDI